MGRLTNGKASKWGKRGASSPKPDFVGRITELELLELELELDDDDDDDDDDADDDDFLLFLLSENHRIFVVTVVVTAPRLVLAVCHDDDID
jgi:hypothetical protein